jgi:hypothetical protein
LRAYKHAGSYALLRRRASVALLRAYAGS